MCCCGRRKRASRRQMAIESFAATLNKVSSLNEPRAPSSHSLPLREIPIETRPPREPAQDVQDLPPPPSYMASTANSRYNFDPADISRMWTERESKEVDAKAEKPVYGFVHDSNPHEQHESAVIFTPGTSRTQSENAGPAYTVASQESKSYRTPPQYPESSSGQGPSRSYVTPYSPSDVGQSPAPSIYAPVGGAPIHGEDSDFDEYEQRRSANRVAANATRTRELVANGTGFLAGIRERREQRHATRALRWHRRVCTIDSCWCREPDAVYQGRSVDATAV